MTDPRHRLGTEAEEAVARWLVGLGWQLLARRLRSAGGGEVDLVLLDSRGTLVGIEVRARRTNRTGTPDESVGVRRVARIGRTLAAFATRTHVEHHGLRVDLVAAEPLPGAVRALRLRRVPNLGG